MQLEGILEEVKDMALKVPEDHPLREFVNLVSVRRATCSSAHAVSDHPQVPAVLRHPD